MSITPSRLSALPLEPFPYNHGHVKPSISWLVSITIALLAMLLIVQPVSAESFIYDNEPAAAIPFNEVNTVLCNEPMLQTFEVTDSFTVNDIDIGFNAEHTYRSDIRLLLQSPKGTRVEVLVEFDLTPEDEDENYDILLDDDVTDLIDDDTNDDVGPPYFERRVQPTNALIPFEQERAQGIWILEVCDAGVEDSGIYYRSRLVFDGTPIGDGPRPNSVSGLVFRDYNADGVYTVRAESGIPNIAVTAYDENGTIIDTTQTNVSGEYTLTVPNDTTTRLEYSGQPAYLQPGPVGPDSVSTVAFVTSPAMDIRVGFANPGQHAQNPDVMNIALPRYAYGANDGLNADMESMVAYRENDGSYDLLTGDGADTSVYDGDATILSRQAETGAIWGVAYDRLHDQLLGAALVKRHSGLGSTGNPTTIYRIDPDTQIATEWFTLDPARTNPHGPNVDWVEDFAVYDAVGKEGWGDIDMGDDLRTLYGVDLGTRQLVILPILEDGGPGTPDTVDIISSLPATMIGDSDGRCPTVDDLRPFGLGINDGTVYLGLVCTAESTVGTNALPIQAATNTQNLGQLPGDFTKLRAYVLAWNGDIATPDFEQIVDFPLRYPRGCVTFNQLPGCEVSYPGEWLPWANAFPYSSDGTANPPGTERFQSLYPQALVSNIEFHNGNMILFLMDRFGHQVGAYTRSPYGEDLWQAIAHSDILFACKRGDGWAMEATFGQDPSCDTGIRAYIRGEERADEYFGEDTYRARFALHGDVGFGAGVAIPGRETVIHAVFDPIYATDTTGDTLYDGGLHWYTIADGHWRKTIRIYNNVAGIVPQEGTFSKAIGLGDIVALTDIPPVEIGNLIWQDTNRDGIQSPGEPGLAGVTVTLFCPDVGPDGIAGNGDEMTAIASVQTSPDGHYYFSSATGTNSAYSQYGLTLINGANCLVQIPDATGANQQLVLTDLFLTESNDQVATPSGSDWNDSDGVLRGDAVTVEFVIGAPGFNRHTYDFGFVDDPPVILHSVGNQVWLDVDDDAVINDGESGVSGVAVTLYDSNDAVISTTTTADNGLYLFAGLSAGQYRVGVDASNFAPGGIFEGCRTSSEALDEDDPDRDVDSNDNGLLSMDEVRSALLTLGADEPTDENPDNDPTTPDARENLTLDFGIFCADPPVILHSVGNQVWLDIDDDAVINDGESGVSGVAVTLYDSNDVVISTTLTADNGLYLFAGLSAGQYRVGVDASNFAPGGIFEGCRTSSEALDEDDPDLDVDGNDNGLLSTDEVRSALLTLGADEPTDENPDNDPTTPDARENLTLDFGIFCAAPPVILHSVGNQVWLDVDDDAVINDGESGVSGVALTLYDSNDVVISTTLTADNGLYLFAGLSAGQYRVGVDASNFAPGGIFEGCRTSSEALDEDDPDLDVDGNDNGLLSTDEVRSALLTLGADEPTDENPDNDPTTPDARENLTLDFGIFCGHSVGNQVWLDVNNNAIIDAGEVGVGNVALTLFSTNGTADEEDDRVIAQTTTTNGGFYLFTDLPAGEYYVQLDATNFAVGGGLQSCISSNEAIDEDTPNSDQDNNDNGIIQETFVRSGPVQLGGNEPLDEDPDNDLITLDHRENLTVDFGCYLTVSLGNRIWFDEGDGDNLYDNGVADSGEVGVAGVFLALLNGEKEPVLDHLGQPITTTSDIAGYYLFTELLPGDYVVQVLPVNFQPGGVLEGYRSSSSTEEDPNQDEDANDNGIDSSTPDVDGICSNVVALTYSTEPNQEPDPGQLPDRALDSNSNLTIDFGFVQAQPTTLDDETEPSQQHRFFVPWVGR